MAVGILERKEGDADQELAERADLAVKGTAGADAGEDQCVDQPLGEIVGEGHPADRSERPEQASPPRPAQGKDDPRTISGGQDQRGGRA